MIEIKQAHINNGEPHWTSEGQASILSLIKAAFHGEKVIYVPAHHVSFIVGDNADEANRTGDIYEMASLETFIFNHGIARKLFGENYLNILCNLVKVPELDRLSWLMENKNLWEK